MAPNINRRTFLSAAGVALGGLYGSGTVAAVQVPGRYIVDLRSVPASQVRDLDIVHRLDAIDALVVRATPEELTGARFASDLRFRLSNPITLVPAHDLGEPDPSLFGLQWDKQAMRIDEAHALARGDGTRVTVVDSGIDASHPDLARRVNRELSRNFTDDGGDFSDVNGHGTHVAGIVAADRGPAGEGVVGVAPGAELVACRIFDANGSATFGDLLAAMVYGVQVGSDAVNMSVGAYPLPLGDPDVQTMLELTERAAAFALENGTLLVASAGNDGVDLDEDGDVISLPNEAEGVVSVSATGPIGFRWDDDPPVVDPLRRLRRPTGHPAFYTNFGRNAIDLSAAGGNADQDQIGSEETLWFLDLVFSTLPAALDEREPVGYGWAAGTSMSSPQVAGALALLRSRFRDASVTELRDHLLATADRSGSPRFHSAGHLDVVESLTESIAI